MTKVAKILNFITTILGGEGERGQWYTIASGHVETRESFLWSFFSFQL